MMYRGWYTVASPIVIAASFFLSLLVPLATSLAAGKQLSDLEAKSFIEQHWNPGGGFRVYLGDFQVVRERRDLSKRRMALSEFDSYKAWQDLGFIRITLGKDLSQRFTGWDDWNRLFLDDVQLDVQIQPTKEGLPMQVEQKGGDLSFLVIPTGSKTVEKIVQNEPLKIGADEYRVVMGLYSANYTQETAIRLKRLLPEIRS